MPFPLLSTMMTNKPTPQPIKLAILNMIRDRKMILFGTIKSNITCEMKERTWDEIAYFAREMGLNIKSGKYLRDTTWQNWRKRTVMKMENRKQAALAGKSSQVASKYDVGDKIIMDIICEDTTVLGLPFEGPVEETQPGPSLTNVVEAPVPVQMFASQIRNKRRRVFQTTLAERKRQAIARDEEETRYKKKLLLDLDIYKKKLEILELERRLDLPPSHVTYDITALDGAGDGPLEVKREANDIHIENGDVRMDLTQYGGAANG